MKQGTSEGSDIQGLMHPSHTSGIGAGHVTRDMAGSYLSIPNSYTEWIESSSAEPSNSYSRKNYLLSHAIHTQVETRRRFLLVCFAQISRWRICRCHTALSCPLEQPSYVARAHRASVKSRYGLNGINIHNLLVRENKS